MGQSGASWIVSWGGEETLTVDEIWPDGDAPENPTAEDVMGEIRKCGSVSRCVIDWNLDCQGIEVNGRNVSF